MTIPDHLEYALKNEALDLLVWYAIVQGLGPAPFLEWVQREPTGRHSRRAWYLYESLSGQTLPVKDAEVTNYVPLASDALQFTAKEHRSRRHKVSDNLLGSLAYCPLIRKTETLQRAIDSDLAERVGTAALGVEARDLQRATDYLYHKETKASFQIEREEASPDRMEKFVTALRNAGNARWYDEEQLVQLQNAIVEPRYAEAGYRTNQVYVGQTMPWGEERVYYPCPKPEDVSALMRGWRTALLRTVGIHPVCQAAVLGFGFVFIHPFEDGNGRLHRFILHATLARRKFTPGGLVIPVSATMLRKSDEYDAALEAYSRPLLSRIDYVLDEEGEMTIRNDTAPLHRFWDATTQCEYLFAALAEAIEVDLPEELRALRAYDAGRKALLEIVDMPDRKADLLMKLLLQNGYRLSQGKRGRFSEVTDEELRSIEDAVRNAAHSASIAEEEPSLFPPGI